MTGAEEIITTVRSAYAAFSRGDYDAVAEMADPEIQLVTTDGVTNIHGTDQLRQWMEPVTIENLSAEVEHAEAAGNRVLVRQLSRGIGVGSGITIEGHFWAVWTFNELGFVVEVRVFRSDQEAEARAAAGLKE